MQSYLHLDQASGAHVSGAITAGSKENPVLVCASAASALFRLWTREACFGFLSWANLGKTRWRSNFAVHAMAYVFSGGARTMVEDDHPEAAIFWVVIHFITIYPSLSLLMTVKSHVTLCRLYRDELPFACHWSLVVFDVRRARPSSREAGSAWPISTSLVGRFSQFLIVSAGFPGISNQKLLKSAIGSLGLIEKASRSAAPWSEPFFQSLFIGGTSTSWIQDSKASSLCV